VKKNKARFKAIFHSVDNSAVILSMVQPIQISELSLQTMFGS